MFHYQRVLFDFEAKCRCVHHGWIRGFVMASWCSSLMVNRNPSSLRPNLHRSRRLLQSWAMKKAVCLMWSYISYRNIVMNTPLYGDLHRTQTGRPVFIAHVTGGQWTGSANYALCNSFSYKDGRVFNLRWLRCEQCHYQQRARRHVDVHLFGNDHCSGPQLEGVIDPPDNLIRSTIKLVIQVINHRTQQIEASDRLARSAKILLLPWHGSCRHSASMFGTWNAISVITWSSQFSVYLYWRIHSCSDLK